MKNIYVILISAFLFSSCGGGNGKLVGSWVQPIPGQENSMQGIKLDKDGKASSINMHTLLYETWEKKGDMLLLTGKSMGNGQIITFTDSLKIESVSKDALKLKMGDYEMSYTKQK